MIHMNNTLKRIILGATLLLASTPAFALWNPTPAIAPSGKVIFVWTNDPYGFGSIPDWGTSNPFDGGGSGGIE